MHRIAILVGILVAGGLLHAQQTLPDLVIDAPRVQASLYFQVKNFTRNDCAVQEGSVGGTGKRTLMRFDVSAANLGTADLLLGRPADHPELYVYSPCHRHYHFGAYASYELLNADGTTRVTGRKQAFCLEDFERYSATAGPAQYTCSYQGISVGWADTYGSYLDGQWIDVTGVPPGNYRLRVTINPYNVYGESYLGYDEASALAMTESDYRNNTALVSVTIPARVK